MVYTKSHTEESYSNLNQAAPIYIDHAVVYQTDDSPKELLKDIQSLQSKDANGVNITVIQGDTNMGTTIIYEPYHYDSNLNNLRIGLIILLIIAVCILVKWYIDDNKKAR